MISQPFYQRTEEWHEFYLDHLKKKKLQFLTHNHFISVTLVFPVGGKNRHEFVFDLLDNNKIAILNKLHHPL